MASVEVLLAARILIVLFSCPYPAQPFITHVVYSLSPLKQRSTLLKSKVQPVNSPYLQVPFNSN